MRWFPVICAALVGVALTSACAPNLFTSGLGIQCSSLEAIKLSRNELLGDWTAVEIYTLGIGVGIAVLIPRQMCMHMKLEVLDDTRTKHTSLDVNATTGVIQDFITPLILTHNDANGKFLNDTEHLQGFVVAEVEKQYIVVAKCGPVFQDNVPILWSLTIYRSANARDLSAQELQDLKTRVKNKLSLQMEQAQTAAFAEQCYHKKD